MSPTTSSFSNRLRLLGGLLFGSLCALSTGCGEPELMRVTVEDARLENILLDSSGFVGTWLRGSADLIVKDTDDETHRAQVGLGGAAVSPINMGHFESEPGSAEFDLGEAVVLDDNEGIVGSQLFGLYSGVAASGAVGIGGQIADLKNEHQIRVIISSMSRGMGMSIAFEWLDISLRSEDQ